MFRYPKITDEECFRKFENIPVEKILNYKNDPHYKKYFEVSLVMGIFTKVVYRIILIRAAESGNLKLVKYSMDNGTGILLSHINKALFNSIINSHYEILAYFHECGGDINYQDENTFWTGLHSACYRNNFKMVKYLIEKGADPYVENRLGNAIFNALINSNVLEYLLSIGMNPNKRNSDFDTPLHIACILNDLTAIKLLIKFGAEINAMDYEGSTPLYNAVLYGKIEAVQLLLDNGADPNIPNIFGNYPLYYACSMGNRKIVKKLLQNGADINYINIKNIENIQTSKNLKN